MSIAQIQFSESTLAWLQELIQANIDSRNGFREAAANLTPGDSLATSFSRLSRQRDAHLEELQALVADHNALPREHGTVMGTVQRIWLDVRAALGAGGKGLLAEAEASEDRLIKHYESALNDLQDSDCSELLRKHLASLRTSREKLHALQQSCDVDCS